MRVLHVIPGVAARDGGPTQAIFGMCSALLRRKIDVLIASTDDADGPGHMDVELDKPLVYRGVPTIFFRWQLSQRFQYSPAMARWLRAHVADYDLVHIHAVFSQPCVAAARACMRDGVPYVVRPLGSLDPWSLRQRRLRKQLLWRLGAGTMLRKASAVHYTSDRERRVSEGPLGLARGVVIPLGVDIDRPVDDVNAPLATNGVPLGRAGPYVLTLSRLDPKKRLDLFIEVFLKAASTSGLGDWKLVVAGKGDRAYVDTLKRRAAELGGNDRITFTGWVEGAEKAALLSGAALLAQPSRQENFALSVVEALAQGVPVLVSDQMDIAGDIAQANAGWVTPLEPQAMLQVLGQALQNESERAARGAAGRALVKSRFTWEAVGDRLVDLYDSIVKKTVAA